MFSASKSKGASSGYQIANSLRFRSSANAYLTRTPASAGNRQTWTWSGWVKRGTLSTAQTLFSSDVGTSNTTWLEFGFDASDTFTITAYSADSNTTSAVFRDPSSWYHIVVAFDSTQATAANRCKIYVNGVQQTLTGAGFTLNASYGINNNQIHGIGYRNWASGVGRYFDGYMADVNFIDGQVLTPSSFGQINATTGVWQPIRYSGTYGTNGFKLNFSNGTSTTTLGYDSSGNSNNWTTNNISLTAGSTYDWMIDSPTPFAGSSYGVGNYAVLNPIAAPGFSGAAQNGNLTANGAGGAGVLCSTIGMSSGKWYAEATCVAIGDESSVGITSVALGFANNYVGGTSTSWGYYTNGNKYTNSSGSAYGASWTTNDTLGIAFDADAGTLVFYKNGTSQGTAFSGLTSGPYYFAVEARSATPNNCAANFGQRPFAYTPPTGFKALCTQNLPTPSIQNGASYMAATTYTGTGATQSISNAVNSVSFQPDFVWIKSRSAATDHALYDVIRGAQNRLESNTTDAAAASDNGLTAFGSTGFTVNTLAQVNTNSATYIGWQWKAGGTAVSNTAGSITSSVSANTTAGFSVVTYTGTGSAATVGHGLGVAPSMVIIKARSLAGENWIVGHTSLPSAFSSQLNLNSTAAYAASSNFNSTNPTASVFSIGSGTAVNSNTNTYVAYCFAAIAGYSAFGSYTGNGSADGPFVYCGFRPRFVLVKSSTSVTNWFIYDTTRDPYNAEQYYLIPNSSSAEGTVTFIDGLSNGFKVRYNASPFNVASDTLIYAAFAENPFQNSLAR